MSLYQNVIYFSHYKLQSNFRKKNIDDQTKLESDIPF